MNQYVVYVANGSVFYQQRVNDVPDEDHTQYDPMRHRQLRIRGETTSSGNVVHFETSDGMTWTDRKMVMAMVPTTALAVYVYGGAFQAGGPPTMAVFDNYVVSGTCPSGL